jgi:putative sigma-54 modulation protein
MQMNISGKNVEVTEGLRSHVHKSFEKISRHLHNMTNVHVILSIDANEQIAEATINVKNDQLFAKAADSDMYAAIDALCKKLDRQATDYKNKMQDHHNDRD